MDEGDDDEQEEEEADEPLGPYPMKLSGTNMIALDMDEIAAHPLLNTMINYQVNAFNAYHTYSEMRDNVEASAAQFALAEAEVQKRRAEEADLELRYAAAKRNRAEAETNLFNVETNHRILEKHAHTYGEAHCEEILHVEKYIN
jgi:hypothetical protein